MSFSANSLEIILEIIESSGDIDLACIQSGVSRKEFNKELNGNQSFRKLVEVAKVNFTHSVTTEWELVAVKYIDKLLKGEVTKTTIINRYVRPGEAEDDDDDSGVTGMELATDKLYKLYTEERIEHVAPPKWLLERYLPKEEKDSIVIDVNFSAMPDEIDLTISDPESKKLE